MEKNILILKNKVFNEEKNIWENYFTFFSSQSFSSGFAIGMLCIRQIRFTSNAHFRSSVNPADLIRGFL